MTPELITMILELCDTADSFAQDLFDDIRLTHSVADCVRAALPQQPAPLADGPAVQGREPASVTTQPSDDELAAIYHDSCSGCEFMDQGGFEDGARAVLARWGTATPQPIPVFERLQQMEDLAADAVAGLRYIEHWHGRLSGVGWDRVFEKAKRLKSEHGVCTAGRNTQVHSLSRSSTGRRSDG